MAHHIDEFNEVNDLATSDIRRVATALVNIMADKLDLDPDELFEEFESALSAQMINDPDSPPPHIEDISPRL